MAKYIVALVLSLTPFVTYAQSQQPRLVSVDQGQAQRIAAERETSKDRTPESQREMLEREQIAHLVAERQLQLRRDTDKLVALTAELKQHVDKTDVNTLSMDVIKRAQEIQKLAKSVQDKMKNAY